MKISKQLIKISTILKNSKEYFDEDETYNWKKYKSVSNDVRNIYKIQNNMINKWKNDKKFQDAYNAGYLFFDQNEKLCAIHSKETFGKLQPQKCKDGDYLVIGSFNDCYPINEQTFKERYDHINGSQYLKKSNIIIQAIQNPFNYQIIVKNQKGDLNCKINDYIVKNQNGYSVIDQKIFNATYQPY